MSCKGKFSEIGKQLQSVLVAFMQSDDLMRLIYYKDSDPLSQPAVPDVYSTLNTQLFPFAYRPPSDTQNIYISVFFGDFRKSENNPFFKRGRLYVNVAVHRDLYLINNSTRIYEIMHQVDSILNRMDVTGSLSKDWFERAMYSNVNDFYPSYTLEYQMWDA